MTPPIAAPDVPPAAAILAIGDELILGQSLDTNSQFIAARLSELGFAVREHATLPDDQSAITAAITRLTRDTSVLVISGGLGPTADDLTRQALAAAMGEELVTDEAALAVIEAWYTRRSRAMPQTNRVQALRPAGASMIDNPHGTAPGLAAAIGDCRIYCLPGPPREMKPMFERAVTPLAASIGTIRTRVLSTFGLGESAVAQQLGSLMDRARNPLVGTTASQGVVSVRLRATGLDEAALDQTEQLVRNALGDVIFARDASLAEHVITRLRQRSETLATVESCTGGLVGSALTDIAGASAAYLGGLVTYTNELKTALAGVEPAIIAEHGAVSRACAIAMAQGARTRLGATHAVAVTGIAGPEGGSEAKPVGTVWFALASENMPTDVRRFRFPGDRASVRTWGVATALAIVRLRLDDVATSMLFEQTQA